MPTKNASHQYPGRTIKATDQALKCLRSAVFVTPIDDGGSSARISATRLSRNRIRLVWCSYEMTVTQAKLEAMVLRGDEGPWRLLPVH